MSVQTYINGTSFKVAMLELRAWQLDRDEMTVALQRVKEDFAKIIAASTLAWRHRPCTRRIELMLPMPRNKGEAAGDAAFREILEAVLPGVNWEVHHG